jgi:ADP-heptose:LPS heptosyltransferase
LLTDSPRFVSRRPEVDSRLALLAELHIDPPGGSDSVGPRIDPGDVARRLVSRRLADVATPDRPLFAVHLGAGTSAKRWPLKSWRLLIARLVSEHNAQVALVGGDEDRNLAAQIAAHFAVADVSDWTGGLRLAETAALLEHAELFVGADSGPAHLASSVGTAAVVLFSGTNDSRQWRPWGANVVVVRHEVACSPCHRTECFWADHPCMHGLSVAVVAREIEHFWRKRAGKGAAHWHSSVGGDRRESSSRHRSDRDESSPLLEKNPR